MVEEGERVLLGWVENVVALAAMPVVLGVEDAAAVGSVVVGLELLCAEVLMDAAVDVAAARAEVLAVFWVDRKACAVPMYEFALTVTTVPPTTTVAAGSRATTEESRAESGLSSLDCAATPLCGRLLFPPIPLFPLPPAMSCCAAKKGKKMAMAVESRKLGRVFIVRWLN